jgi:hypothetical protein
MVALDGDAVQRVGAKMKNGPVLFVFARELTSTAMSEIVMLRVMPNDEVTVRGMLSTVSVSP